MGPERVTFAIDGELGNQLFIWATGYGVSLTQNRALDFLIYSTPWRLENYKIPEVRCKRRSRYYVWLLKKIPIRKKYKQKMSEIFIPLSKKDIYNHNIFIGYFCSWKNFHFAIDSIRSLLVIKNESTELLKLKSLLSSAPFIAVHIRRGNSGLSKINKDFHGILPLEYYQNAQTLMTNLTGITNFVFFTDNKSEAMDLIENLNIATYRVITAEDLSSQQETLELMTYAKGIIAANSSFSWWAAYLAKDSASVKIFPRPFYLKKDIHEGYLLMPHWLSVGFLKFENEA